LAKNVSQVRQMSLSAPCGTSFVLDAVAVITYKALTLLAYKSFVLVNNS